MSAIEIFRQSRDEPSPVVFIISGFSWGFEGAFFPDSSSVTGCTSRPVWRLGSVATKSDSKPRLFVRNWVEQYRQIPRLALALQIRSNIEPPRAFQRSSLDHPHQCGEAHAF